MTSQQRLNDQIKTISRVRGTSPESILEHIDAISKNTKIDLYLALDEMNKDVLRNGMTVAATLDSLKKHIPTIEPHHHDFVIVVYNYLYHGGLLK